MKYLTVLILFSLLAFTNCSQSSNSKASDPSDYSFETIDKELLQQDLDTLFFSLKELHPDLYHKSSSETWEDTYTSIKKKLTKKMNKAEFFLHLLPLFALEKDGHTFVNFPTEYSQNFNKEGGTFFPFKVRFKDRQIYLEEDYSGKEIPAYAKLLEINGISASKLVEDMEQIETTDRYSSLEPYISYFFKYLLYPRYNWTDEFSITYLADNETTTTQVKGISLEDYPKKPFDYFSFDIDKQEQFATLDLNLCENYKAFPAFCDSIFTLLKEKEIPNLIVDLRGNTGGTTRHGDTLITYLTDKAFTQYDKVTYKRSKLINPTLDSSYLEELEAQTPQRFDNKNRFKGEVYVLIDGITFSSATILAATIQCYDIGTLIGQETGGTQIMYSSFRDFILPHSKLFVGISTDIRQVPCGKNFERGIIPDYETKYTLEDLQTKRDLEVEKVREMILK